MRKAINNTLRHLVTRDPETWHPLLAVYYLTYACDFRCPYCSDGNQTPYYKLRGERLAVDDVMRVLGEIRNVCDHLVITGGEPTKYPQLENILERLPQLGFDGVVFTTNGFDVVPHLSALAESVDYLVFSLDTLDAEKADHFFGVGRGTLEQILENIAVAARPKKRPYEIIISSVVTPDNIPDLYRVYDYAQKNAFRFAACPQLNGVKAPPALIGNSAYESFFQHLIDQKKSGAAINGSVAYLEYLQGFKDFDCRPSTVLAVSPGGDVFYPCLEQGKIAGNLLATPDLNAIREMGKDKFGPEPHCDNRCHSACALGLSLALNQPATALHEALLQAKNIAGSVLG
jgi:MoaA/NifB/PqqE/SkfB family radical SAM enzyme